MRIKTLYKLKEFFTFSEYLFVAFVGVCLFIYIRITMAGVYTSEDNSVVEFLRSEVLVRYSRVSL